MNCMVERNRCAIRLAAALLPTLFLAACGGGGGADPAPLREDAPPSIGAIADQAVVGDGLALTLALRVDDDVTPVSALAFEFASSDERIVSPADITLTDATAAEVTIAPRVDELGSTEITITVRDGVGQIARSSFRFEVLARRLDFARFARDVFAAPADGAPAFLNAIEFFDASRGEDFDDLID